MEVKTYSPSDVHMTFGGIVVSGWDSISIMRRSQTFRTIKGIRGKNTRVRDRDTSATIEVVLAQSSDINYILDTVAEMDSIYGTGRLEITIKDRNGEEVFYTSEAFIEKPSDKIYDDDLQTRTWTIQCLSSGTSGNTTGGYLGNLFDSFSNFLN